MSTTVAQGVIDDDHHDAAMTIYRQVGGFDTELFAMELQHMYVRFAERHQWRISWHVTIQQSSIGGYQHEAKLLIAGADAYAHLKYEGGIHRVQRVPVSAPAGRIHTATVKVIVLPVIAWEAQIAILHAGAWDEKIRTDNYPQQRVTDHRVNLNLYNLPSVLDGEIDPFINALRTL